MNGPFRAEGVSWPLFPRPAAWADGMSLSGSKRSATLRLVFRRILDLKGRFCQPRPKAWEPWTDIPTRP